MLNDIVDPLAREILAASEKLFASKWTPQTSLDEMILAPLVLPFKIMKEDYEFRVKSLPPLPQDLTDTMFASGGDKTKPTRMLAAGMDSGVFDGYIFLAETWHAEYEKEQEQDRVQPRHMPNRFTALMVQTHTRDGSRVYLQPMKLGKPSGKLVTYGAGCEGTLLGGSMVPRLHPRR